MKITRTLQLTIAAAVLALAGAAYDTAAAKTPASPEDVAQDYLDAHPGGLRDENEVIYPDGSGFVAVDIGVMSVSQCASNQFCMWSSDNYTGSFKYVTGSGVTKTLTGTVHSIWNNRTKAARLYNNAGSSSTCYSAGTKKAALTATYYTPSKVYLSSGTSC